MRYQHCPTPFNLPSSMKNFISGTGYVWALQDCFLLFKKMLFQSFWFGYNISCSNNHKLQLIYFANNPIPFSMTYWAWYSSLLHYWTWCGKKAKGIIKVYIKYCNEGRKKPMLHFIPSLKWKLRLPYWFVSHPHC